VRSGLPAGLSGCTAQGIGSKRASPRKEHAFVAGNLYSLARLATTAKNFYFKTEPGNPDICLVRPPFRTRGTSK
jgi:hypothetical protein